MMEAVRTSETSVDNHFTRQYIPEDISEHHTRRRENLKSHEMKEYLTLRKECDVHLTRHEPRFLILWKTLGLLIDSTRQ
jgi:hypothetical protein